jgi:hypothetical protein
MLLCKIWQSQILGVQMLQNIVISSVFRLSTLTLTINQSGGPMRISTPQLWSILGGGGTFLHPTLNFEVTGQIYLH